MAILDFEISNISLWAWLLYSYKAACLDEVFSRLGLWIVLWAIKIGYRFSFFLGLPSNEICLVYVYST